ncbi:MAG: DUF5058 family protein [Oscillospiraceae bacterium]|nr:DUF5058 family protein [Oscillospiraceae bacterium]
MQDILKQMSSLPVYLICGAVILFVAIFSLVLLVRAWKAGIAVGMDRTKLKRAVTSSMTFTVLPAISILLGVIALSGTLGIPLPWLRLSVIGALHYEASVADIAAKSVGLSGLRAEEMTLQAFTTIALVMTAGIIWGLVCMLLFGKKYCSKLQGGKKKGGRSFGDDAMNAMFIGLITAYIGSYIGQLVQLQNGALVITGQYLQLMTLAGAALAMGVFIWIAEKKHKPWVENFSIAGSMLVGMTAAVVCGMIF